MSNANLHPQSTAADKADNIFQGAEATNCLSGTNSAKHMEQPHDASETRIYNVSERMFDMPNEKGKHALWFLHATKSTTKKPMALHRKAGINKTMEEQYLI